MNLATYVRLPIKAGVKLTMATNGTFSSKALADPTSKDYFAVLIDNLNEDVLDSLRKRVSGEAYLLAFVRGSVVKNRLAVAQTYWQRLVDCFRLEEVSKDLEQLYGKAAVEKLMFAIKRKVNAELLRDRDMLGPAKLLFRLKKPGAEVFSHSSYASIEALIDEVSTFAQGCDESIRALFYETDLGEARPSVEEQFSFLLSRFELDSAAGQREVDFTQFVQIQREAQCLHPALPIAEEAVQRIANAFGVSIDHSRQLIKLFRFAWLCRLERSKDFSDFTFKSVVVIPQAGTTSAEAHRQAENILGAVFDALKKTMASQPDLQQFSCSYPDVRLRVSAFVLSLPQPLFEAFLAIDCGEERLNFMTKYQMGPAYFKDYITGLLHDVPYKERIAAIDGKYAKQLSQKLELLLDRVIYIKIKIAKDGNLKSESISPHGLSMQRVRELLINAIERPEGEDLEKCSWLFNEICKDDLVGNIKGLWMVQRS